MNRTSQAKISGGSPEETSRRNENGGDRKHPEEEGKRREQESRGERTRRDFYERKQREFKRESREKRRELQPRPRERQRRGDVLIPQNQLLAHINKLT